MSPRKVQWGNRILELWLQEKPLPNLTDQILPPLRLAEVIQEYEKDPQHAFNLAKFKALVRIMEAWASEKTT